LPLVYCTVCTVDIGHPKRLPLLKSRERTTHPTSDELNLCEEITVLPGWVES